jgi:hypothetical protein
VKQLDSYTGILVGIFTTRMRVFVSQVAGRLTLPRLLKRIEALNKSLMKRSPTIPHMATQE